MKFLLRTAGVLGAVTNVNHDIYDDGFSLREANKSVVSLFLAEKVNTSGKGGCFTLPLEVIDGVG